MNSLMMLNSTLVHKEKKTEENCYTEEIVMESDYTASNSQLHVSDKKGKRIKKRNKKKHVAEFECPDVNCLESEDLLHYPVKTALSSGYEPLQKKSKQMAAIYNGSEMSDKDTHNFMGSNLTDSSDNRNKIKKKKKKKYAAAVGLENESMSIQSDETEDLAFVCTSDVADRVEAACGDQENNREKERKAEKHVSNNEFENRDVSVTDAIDQSQNSSNITDNCHSRRRRRKKKKKNHSAAVEVENENISTHNDETEDFGFICSLDAKNEVEATYEDQENNRGKKRKTEKHVSDNEFDNRDVSVTDSIDQSQNSSNITDNCDSRSKRKKKKKKNHLAAVELENESRSTHNDETEDFGFIGSSDFQNEVEATYGDQKNNRGKKRKTEKHISDSEFESRDVFVTDSTDQSQNSFYPVHLSEKMFHKRKKKKKAEEAKNATQNEDKDMDNFLNSNATEIGCASEDKDAEENLKPDTDKNVILSAGKDSNNFARLLPIKAINLSEDTALKMKNKKKKKQRVSENDEISVLGEIRNDTLVEINVEPVEQRFDSHEEECLVEEADENTAKNRGIKRVKKKKKEKVLIDGKLSVSDEMRNDQVVENSIGPVEKIFDSCKKQHLVTDVDENATENGRKDLHTTVMVAEDDFLKGIKESRFDRKIKHSTPNPSKLSEYRSIPLFCNTQQLERTLADNSSFLKPTGENLVNKKNLEAQCNDQELNTKFLDTTSEDINSASNCNKGINKNKIKHGKHKTNDGNSSEKEKAANENNSKGKDVSASTPTFQDRKMKHEKKNLSSHESYSIKKKLKETNHDKLKTDDGNICEKAKVADISNSESEDENSITTVELESESSPKKNKAPKKHLSDKSESDSDFDGFDTTSITSFSLPVLDDNEDPVNFTVPELHAKESVSAVSKAERALFEKQGITVKLGKWLKSEDDILKRNYEKFCRKFKINDPRVLLGVSQSRRCVEIVKFIKAKHFYARLGQDLGHRTLFGIYSRARTLFHPLRNDEKCSPRDVSSLKEAYNRYGNKWIKIGGILDKRSTRIRESHRWSQKPVKKGRWSREEEENLINAIKSVAKTSEISPKLIKGISWEQVAELVPTRNFSQCRLHWGEYMAWDPEVKKTAVWSKGNDNEMLEIIKNKHLRNATEIDWEDIYESFKNVAPSYMFLQKRWRALKRSANHFLTMEDLFVK